MQVEGSKLSVRLKLSDFIENFEEIVISRINKIYKDLNRPFVLYLWYDNEEVSPKQLKSFMLDWESSLNWKTIIRKGNTVKINEGIWYNISPVRYRNYSGQRPGKLRSVGMRKMDTRADHSQK